MEKTINMQELVELVNKSEKSVVFVGPTAAGKDTLMNEVSRRTGIKPLVSHTTRPMRPGEVDGVEYYFVTDDQFESMEMVERRTYTVANGETWKYGLSVQEASRPGLLILDLSGYLTFSRWCSRHKIESPQLVYLPVDYETAKARQQKRGDYDEAEFNRRWEADSLWTSNAEFIGITYKEEE